jgi:hypothetical protein
MTMTGNNDGTLQAHNSSMALRRRFGGAGGSRCA